MKKIIFFLSILLVFMIGITSIAYSMSSDGYSIDRDLVNQISGNVPEYTTIDKIPQDFINALIAVEDHRFYEHHGFDTRAIARAFWVNLREGEIKQGGSTITQQLAKNLFLSNEKTYTRKYKELILAIKLEKRYSKDEILEMYSNAVYFGSDAYGIQAASRKYFDKDVEELSREECAMLAGILQAPSAYNPEVNPEKAAKRRQLVLSMMESNKLPDEVRQENAAKPMVSVFQ